MLGVKSVLTLSTLHRFRRVLIVVVQLLLVALSNYVAFLLRFDGLVPAWALLSFLQGLPGLLVIRGLMFVAFRLYQGLWRYTGLYDLWMLAGGIGASSVLFFVYTHTPLVPGVYPRSIYVIDAGFLVLLLGGIRLARRVHAQVRGGRSTDEQVLVYGAGDAGETVVREMKQYPSLGFRPIGFIDDDVTKAGQRIHGVRVLGTGRRLPDLLEKYRPTLVLIAIPQAPPELIRAINSTVTTFKIPIKTLPRLHGLMAGVAAVKQIRPLSIEDLLARPPIKLPVAPVRALIQNRRVMVTGAGGSIGSELCRQILAFQPAGLILFERYENSLHTIRLDLEAERERIGHPTQIHAVVGDITDARGVEGAFSRYRPEIVFHAAAHKHVPLMEENPCEAVKNNIRGTRILTAAAERAGVDRFIMISTDKAANPTTVMGASKRVAEQIVLARSLGSGTSYAVVRFGNVLGSNGSVVPQFAEQIKRGGPVTVTHPDVKRFFMLIPEAVQLVLHAAAKAHGGGMYVLNMGEQVKIADLAANMIRQAGHVPDEDIKIVFIGLRPGDKLEEELTSGDEQIEPTDVSEVSSVVRSAMPAALWERVESLEDLATAGNVPVVVEQLMALAGAPGSVSIHPPTIRAEMPTAPSTSMRDL
jgi:FlaA1/EpsC-like NDP-sugar epimerase